MKTPKLVGVLNITPDSFSDGNLFYTANNAIRHTEQLIEHGANIIDVGAESRKPNQKSNLSLITEEEELERLRDSLPQIIDIAHKNNCEVSIDTRHPSIAQYAIDHGIDWINDAGAFSDQKMIDIVAKTKVKLVLMFNRGLLGNHKENTIPEDQDPVSFLISWGKEKINELMKNNIQQDRIVFDVGIGYGQSHIQSWKILKNITKIKDAINLPIYVGHSRKSMFNPVCDIPFHERDLETVIISQHLINNNIDFLRVHNIKFHTRLLNVMKFMDSIE